jgi:hypothetical protein
MKVFSALRDGIGRVNRAPAVLFGVLIATFLVALPLGLTLQGMIGQHLGASLAAERAANGVNLDWWQEFLDQAAGVGTTFTPSIIGFGGILDNLSSVLDNRRHATVVAAAGAAYVLFWIFIVGGILDRYARNRPVRAHGFFSASGVFFFRFLRLAVLAWIGYGVLFSYVHTWLFGWLYPWVIRDFTVERNAFVVRVILYLVFGLLLLALNMLFDYAKIRAVVEDRRSMIGALVAGGRFVARHPASASGLYLLNGALFVLVLALYASVAPGAGGPGWSIWLGLAVGQLYLLARLWVKLVFYASQTSFFQGRLAHAEYTAAPQPVWPESPAAEAIGPSPAPD